MILCFKIVEPTHLFPFSALMIVTRSKDCVECVPAGRSERVLCQRHEAFQSWLGLKVDREKRKDNNSCCGASVASEQQHEQDLKRIYRRGYEFSNSSLFTIMHCI